VPFVDLDCASLVPTAVAQAAIKAPITAQSAVFSQGYLLTDGLPSVHEPMTFATRIAGGFTCEWSNGVPQVLDVSENPAYSGAILDVLPNATDAWNAHLAYLNSFGGKTEYCAAYDSAQCDIEALIDGSWYHLRSFNVNVAVNASDAAVAAAARTIIDAAAASIAAAAQKSGKPGVLAGTAALSEDCGQFFTPAELNAATGMSLSASPEPASTGEIYTMGTATWSVAHAKLCSWFKTGDQEGYYDMALLSWLEGGEWAFNEVKAGGGFANATELDVPGLSVPGLDVPGPGADGAAYLECNEDRCGIDILVSHDWVWFSIWANSSVSAVTPNAAAAAIAAKIVEQLG
jgi:hypothetical protein